MILTELVYKPDWEKARQRLLAWWNGEIIDRAAFQVRARKDGIQRRQVPEPQTLEECWTNPEYVVEAAEANMEVTYYGGETFPKFWPNLGPDVFVSYFGAQITFAESTSWSTPLLPEWDSAEIRLDKQNRFWRLTNQMTDLAVLHCSGKYFVGMTDFHGGIDAIAALRGPERLALDMLDQPEKIHALMDILTPLWYETYNESYSRTNKVQTGTTTWFELWSPGRWYPVSCDFICMISREMFEEFVLPDIAAQIEWLDHSIFHLDGPGAVRHLDALLSIEKLNGIQWVPGAGDEDIMKWVPMLKRIQNAGKLIHMTVNPSEVEPLLDALKPEGLMLATWVGTQNEAENLIRLVEQKTRRQ